MKIKSFEEYIKSDIPLYEYDNDNFLDFLRSVKFKLNAPFIHVTGTSGKSVIVEVLSNIYSSAGYKVGSFKSDDFDMDRNELYEKYAGFAVIFEKNWKIINKFELTIYELLIYCMLEQFNNERVDLVILETIMGGYWDTTNIEEKPALAIINNVGLEHCDVLGKSVSEIALNKSGIIKKDSLVLLNSDDEDVKFVVNEEVKKTKSKLVQVAEFYDYNIVDLKHLEIGYHPFPKFTVNTTALYNRENIACVLEAINLLQNKFSVKAEYIQEGLSKNISFGYFNILKINDKTIIFDKANNPFAIEKLCKSLRFSFEDMNNETNIMFSVAYEKNLEKMLSTLSYVTHNIVLTTYDSDLVRDENGFFLFLQDYSYIQDYKEGIKQILSDESKKLIVFTGDKQFVLKAYEYIKSL